MSELRLTPRNFARAVVILPFGAALIALGLGLGEYVARPIIRLLFGPPQLVECVNTWSQEAHWLAEVAAGVAAVAVGAGALLGRRRRDGWLYFNLLSMVPAYWLRAAFPTWDETPLYLYWGLWNWLAQGLVVCVVCPRLFGYASAWRHRTARLG